MKASHIRYVSLKYLNQQLNIERGACEKNIVLFNKKEDRLYISPEVPETLDVDTYIIPETKNYNFCNASDLFMALQDQFNGMRLER